jgi:hypothetical protein
MNRWVAGLGFLILTQPALALTEAEYVAANCTGEIEVRLPDRTRIDCLLEDEAQEYDFGKKWAEAIGQALWYAMNSGRRAGIVLIIEDNSDRAGLKRARFIIAHYNLPITLHTVE